MSTTEYSNLDYELLNQQEQPSGLNNVVENALRSVSAADFSQSYTQNYPTALTSVSVNNVQYASGQSSGNCKFLPPISLDQYKLNNDPNPELIRKKPTDRIRYVQDVAIRFLEPPQPPKPGDIVVKHLPNRQIAPAPPLIVRQAPPKPATPAPLVLREAPPQPPARIPDQLVQVPGRVLAPPARKVVVERLPPIPPKPQQIFLEKWLPFKQQKRRVVYQQPDPDCVLPNPRNLVIQWEAPEVEVTRDYRNLGTQLANPEDYVRRFGSELLRHEEFKQAATRIGAPDNVTVSDSHRELGLPELEGQVEALSLVDISRSELASYAQYLSSQGVRYNASLFSNEASPFGFITSTDSANLLSYQEASSIASNLNASTEKPISDSELRSYFASIDTNGDGVLSFEEFRAAGLSTQSF